MSFVSSYGDHRDLHLLTHSFPPRRSSDLSACRRRARRMGSARSLLGGGGAQRAGLFLWPLRAAGILEAGESHGFFMATGQSFRRSEEHTSELQSLMRISYAVFCLKKKNTQTRKHHTVRNTIITQKQ